MFKEFTPYHIVSRAIEGRKIFARDEDTDRFIFQKYVANIGRPIANLRRRDLKKVVNIILNGGEVSRDFIIVEHPPLVSCLSFSFVVNHTHDVMISNVENGISKYYQKLHTGFSKYFNIKYNRHSNLFTRPQKIIPIKTEAQLYAVIRYVNIKNPLDVFQPNWITNGLIDKKKALAFLFDYRFSSFPDLSGKRNSKILASKTILDQFLIKEITGKDCTKFVNDYLEEKLSPFNPFFLE